MERALNNLDYTFFDLSKYIKSSIPNGDIKHATMSQSYYLMSILEILTNIEGTCSSVEECVVKISKYHRMYINDIGSMTTTCILTINCEVHAIENEAIQCKANIFKRLPTYAKNPLEPLLKLLVKDSPYKVIIGKIVGDICRGSHVDAKVNIYELEDLIKNRVKQEDI